MPEGFASDPSCLFLADVGGAVDKISLIPQDFFAELVSRAVRGIQRASGMPRFLETF